MWCCALKRPGATEWCGVVHARGGATAAAAEEELATVVAGQGHALFCGRFLDGQTRKYLLGCWRCGCYAAGRVEGLRLPCRGKADTKGKKEQLSASKRGVHPLRKQQGPVTLEEVRPATAAQMAWLGELWSSTAAADLVRPSAGLDLAAVDCKWTWLEQLLGWQLDAYGGGAAILAEEAEGRRAESFNA